MFMPEMQAMYLANANSQRIATVEDWKSSGETNCIFTPQPVKM
jgi:hypothetical protein